MKTLPRPSFYGVLAGLFLAAGLVLAASIATRAWLAVTDSESISVTGSARRTIASDLIIWNGNFSVQADELIQAQQNLQHNRELVASFLRDHGVTNWTFSAATIDELHPRTKKDEDPDPTVSGYKLAQTVTVRSGEVQKTMDLDALTTELIDHGVEFVTGTPEFIYTKSAEAKVEMLAEATRDARIRASQIASEGGRRLAGLRSARMGVFQITPIYSTATSSDGINDTTSLEKTVSATVAARFTMR